MGKPHKDKEKKHHTDETNLSMPHQLVRNPSVADITAPKKHKKSKKHKDKAATASSSDASQQVSLVLDGGDQYQVNDVLVEIPPPRKTPEQRKERKKKKARAENAQTESVPLTSDIDVPAIEPAPSLNIAPEKKASCCHCFSFFRKKQTKETQPLLPAPIASLKQ